MKFFTLLVLITVSSFSIADDQNKDLVGELANSEHKDCMGTDSCPSQKCPGSCAMMNATQNETFNEKGKTGSTSKDGAIQE